MIKLTPKSDSTVKYINTSPPIDERPKAICTAYSTTVREQA